MRLSASLLTPLLVTLRPRPRMSRGSSVAALKPALQLIDGGADVISGFRERVAECNQLGQPSVPFFVGNTQAGEVAESLIPHLRELGRDVFHCTDDAVRLTQDLAEATLKERTEAVAQVTLALREAGLVHGWRNELISLATGFGEPPALNIERACVPLFGGKGYGVFLNGWCRDPSDNMPWLWVAMRSKDKPTWPGMLDVMVGGAVSAGSSPSATLVQEAGEEAGIPDELARQALPVSCCSYRGTDERGFLKRDVLFCYDLELPWEFEPTAVDGEVESFERMSLSAVAEAVAYGQPAAFKPNCNLVVIDFLVRCGYLTPETPGYLRLLAELRSGDCR